MTEVAERQQQGQGRDSPSAQPIAPGPPDAQRDREEARPQHEAGEPEQPGDIQSQEHREQGRQRHPGCSCDPQSEPEHGRREPGQRERHDHPLGDLGGKDRHQGGRQRVTGPVGQGLPAHLVKGSKGRLRIERPRNDLSIIEMRRAVLGDEPGVRPDRREGGKQGDPEDEPTPPECSGGRGILFQEPGRPWREYQSGPL